MAGRDPGCRRQPQRPARDTGARGHLYALERANLLPLRRQIMLELVERGIPDALGLEA